jgi:hypothetical protein
MESDHTLYSGLLVPLVVFLLAIQPAFMFLCQLAPSFMASLLSNPHTSTFESNTGAKGLNLQLMGLLVYHTTLTDRAMHVISFCLDALAQATLAAHVYWPAAMHAGAKLASIFDLPQLGGQTIGWLLVVTVASLYGAQLFSLGGWRLLAGVWTVWTVLITARSYVEWLLFSSLPAPLLRAVCVRAACMIILVGMGMRLLGHAVDHQNVGVIGNQHFMRTTWRVPTLAEFRVRPLWYLLCSPLWIAGPVAILISSGLAELNAGMPFRLFPVLIHLVMLRLGLNGPPPVQEDDPTKLAADPEHELMGLPEMSRVVSYIVRHGWNECPDDLVQRLHLQYVLQKKAAWEKKVQKVEKKLQEKEETLPSGLTTLGSPRLRRSPSPLLESVAEIKSDNLHVSSEGAMFSSADDGATVAASAIIAPRPLRFVPLRSPRRTPSPTCNRALSPSLLQQEFEHVNVSDGAPVPILTRSKPQHSRRFSALKAMRSYKFSKENTIMHQTPARKGTTPMILPLESDTFALWGLWPEVNQQR